MCVYGRIYIICVNGVIYSVARLIQVGLPTVCRP